MNDTHVSHNLNTHITLQHYAYVCHVPQSLPYAWVISYLTQNNSLGELVPIRSVIYIDDFGIDCTNYNDIHKTYNSSELPSFARRLRLHGIIITSHWNFHTMSKKTPRSRLHHHPINIHSALLNKMIHAWCT